MRGGVDRSLGAENPDYKSMIGAFVADDKLYSIWYISAEPYCYDKHAAEAENVIQSASVVNAQ